MKIRMIKTWNPLADSFQLTRREIESQVLSDLSKYRERYQEHYGKPAPVPLDVDNFVFELWGFSVSFENIPHQTSDEEILGFLRPETKQVVVNDDCTNQKRISFTVSHEAGHLSLHRALFSIRDGIIIGWNHSVPSKNKKKLSVANLRREWQANVYAGSLLAPKIEVETILQELGLIKDQVLTPFNLDNCFPVFEERLGLSRQALEIRLEHLAIPFEGAKYQKFEHQEKPPISW